MDNVTGDVAVLWLEEQVPVILLWAPGIGLCPLSHMYEQVLACSTFGHMDSYVHRYISACEKF